MVTIDASALIDALIDGSDRGRRLRGRLRTERLIAPEVIDLEVVSALRRLEASGRLTTTGASTAVEELRRVAVLRVPHHRLITRIWALRANAGPYDAAYIATAEVTGTVLVTADTELTGIPGIACPVEVVH